MIKPPTRAARWSALLWVALALVSLPRAASAQTSADLEAARAYFIEGTKLGNEGRWKEARELYARSLQLKAAPLTRYSLGVAQRETGRLADALGSFRAFLAEPAAAATAPYQAPARAAVTALEASVGRVTIVVEPHPIEGLTLSIDGQPVAPTIDRPREIDPGAHEVVAHAPGFLKAAARFFVTAGAGASVTLTLTRSLHATTGPVEGATAPVDAPLDPLPPAAPSRILPAVLMGVGGGIFAVGLTVGLVGVSQASHATTRDGADASAARAKGIAGDVLGTLGLATLGVGLVILIVQSRSSPARTGAVSLSMDAAGPALRF